MNSIFDIPQYIQCILRYSVTRAPSGKQKKKKKKMKSQANPTEKILFYIRVVREIYLDSQEILLRRHMCRKEKR